MAVLQPAPGCGSRCRPGRRETLGFSKTAAGLMDRALVHEDHHAGTVRSRPGENASSYRYKTAIAA
ncbi:MAG: hypothetical protein JSV80_17855 [Acidobacteriota bacterium]|nr:MAG: hypothetical protein JSV80_17855 [Acidobacteriota bacterium]